MGSCSSIVIFRLWDGLEKRNWVGVLFFCGFSISILTYNIIGRYPKHTFWYTCYMENWVILVYVSSLRRFQRTSTIIIKSPRPVCLVSSSSEFLLLPSLLRRGVAELALHLTTFYIKRFPQELKPKLRKTNFGVMICPSPEKVGRRRQWRESWGIQGICMLSLVLYSWLGSL